MEQKWDESLMVACLSLSLTVLLVVDSCSSDCSPRALTTLMITVLSRNLILEMYNLRLLLMTFYPKLCRHRVRDNQSHKVSAKVSLNHTVWTALKMKWLVIKPMLVTSLQ